MGNSPLEDLRSRLLGKRFYNQGIDESFTVVGIDSTFVYLQYDDGIGWDDLPGPDLVPDDVAFMMDVSEGGIDDSNYIPLEHGLSFDHACADGEHAFYPLPRQVGWDDASVWYSSIDGQLTSNIYLNIVRCKRCGLSGNVLIQFLDHETPDICAKCSDELVPGEDEFVRDATPDWGDVILCESCAEAERAAFDDVEVACADCGTVLGLASENERIAGNSVLGERLGIGSEEYFYICGTCLQKHSSA
ncbi:hypothetical protein [Haladaptatus sp. DYSN1]|uniref:hypothetical protein n=1 Tax=unclassified Haladaptatus TaxID=2622732 RepID=UPI0024063DE4|nr:hypothetical protein [Haladaptatus sp. DYSN1]